MQCNSSRCAHGDILLPLDVCSLRSSFSIILLGNAIIVELLYRFEIKAEI